MLTTHIGRGAVALLLAGGATLGAAGTAAAADTGYGGTFPSAAACDEIGRKVTSNGLLANYRCISNGNPAGDDGTYDLYTY